MADVELLPLPELPRQVEGYNSDYWEAGQIEEYAADYARACVEANLAPLQAENERLRAEVREAREFRDKMANAIGNDQLRRFIEKHGEPVPLTIRMQEAEARAERLAEALREVMLWIENWSPPFTEDDEWPDTEAKAKAALHTTAAQENDDA